MVQSPAIKPKKSNNIDFWGNDDENNEPDKSDQAAIQLNLFRGETGDQEDAESFGAKHTMDEGDYTGATE